MVHRPPQPFQWQQADCHWGLQAYDKQCDQSHFGVSHDNQELSEADWGVLLCRSQCQTYYANEVIMLEGRKDPYIFKIRSGTAHGVIGCKESAEPNFKVIEKDPELRKHMNTLGPAVKAMSGEDIAAFVATGTVTLGACTLTADHIVLKTVRGPGLKFGTPAAVATR